MFALAWRTRTSNAGSILVTPSVEALRTHSSLAVIDLHDRSTRGAIAGH